MRKPIITIDGPAGAGKSSVARRVAQRLGLRFLDTGAMYRAVTWMARKMKIGDPKAVSKLIGRMRLLVDENAVVVDGQDVTRAIRDAEITRAVAPFAASPECRAALVRLQREIGRSGGLVTEGRDQGSVVFPDAEYKFYLDASIDERASRRHRETGGDLARIRQEIEDRDRADMTRKAGPLVKPEGAVVIDTTNMSIDEAVDTICRVVSGSS